MRKVIRSASSREVAEKIVARVKKLPGVTYAKKYMINCGSYHVLITGDFTDEVEKEILKGKRNLAKDNKNTK